MLRSIGADHVIDYTKEDFTKNRERCDVVFDVGGKCKFSDGVGSLKEEGFFLTDPGLSKLIRGAWSSRTSGKKVIVWTGAYKIQDLAFLGELIEAGKIRSVIDRRFSLEQIVEANRFVETGEKMGNVVINIGI